MRGSWRPKRIATYWPPPTLMAISVVSFLFFQCCSTGGPGAQLSAGCWLSLSHLFANSFDYQLTGGPEDPFCRVVAFSTTTSLRLSGFTELYNSSITHSLSLELHVWSSSSGNNYHAVQRSLSSGASVYDCTMGFSLVPYGQPSPPTWFLPITAIGMCHFLAVHQFGMACLAWSKVNI